MARLMAIMFPRLGRQPTIPIVRRVIGRPGENCQTADLPWKAWGQPWGRAQLGEEAASAESTRKFLVDPTQSYRLLQARNASQRSSRTGTGVIWSAVIPVPRCGRNPPRKPLETCCRRTGFLPQRGTGMTGGSSGSPFQMTPAPANCPMIAWCLGVLVVKGFEKTRQGPFNESMDQ